MIPGIIWDKVKDEGNFLGWETLEFVQAVYGGTRTEDKKRRHVTNYIFIVDGEDMVELGEEEFYFGVCECYKMRPRLYDPKWKKA